MKNENILKLEVQKFIETHETWEKLLSEAPYFLKISRETWNGIPLVMLKYSQIESDFSEVICRECRGLILREDTFEIVSFPFMKFGNIGEGSWVDEISWDKKPYVLSKKDGSLIKIVKYGENLLISTNGTILAENAPVADQIGCKAKNFLDLVDEGLAYYKLSRESLKTLLEENYTYMFELTSKWSRVVVPWTETKLWFIGVRNNLTFQETFIKDHPLAKVFETPELYNFDTFEHCIETAKALPWTNEGYVITSRDFKRNKAKSLGYLSVHHLSNNGVMSYKRALDLIRLNETDEVLAYFPEYKENIEKVRKVYEDFLKSMNESWKAFKKVENNLETRKDKALWILKNFKCSGVGFGLLDGKIETVEKWISEVPLTILVKILGFKDEENT